MAGTATAWTKQTEETLISVCDALRAGLPLARSFKAAGISARMGHNWRSKGWSQIDVADAGAGEEMSFEARFAVAVEAAAIQFMGPLVKRIADAATGEGRGKGDWKAAKELLASRFPDEWSERTHVAKSQKVEVAGQISHAHTYFDQLRRMPTAELEDEMLRLDRQITRTTWGAMKDAEKDAWIGHFEGMLSKMKGDRDGLSRWLGDVDWHLRPGLPVPVEDYQPPRRALTFEREPVEILAAAKVAPDKADVAGVVNATSADPTEAETDGAMSFEVHEERRPRGIGYDQNGLAFNFSDADTTL